MKFSKLFDLTTNYDDFLDSHVRSCKHIIIAASRGISAMPKHLAPATLQHSHKHKIYLFLSCLSFSFSLSYHCLYARYIVTITKSRIKRSCVCAHGCRSPLQCPWVLSISGKEARPLADCRECCVRFSRPRPRSGRSVYPSIVIFYRLPTPYSQTNRRRCYRRRYFPRIFSPYTQNNPC